MTLSGHYDEFKLSL